MHMRDLHNSSHSVHDDGTSDQDEEMNLQLPHNSSGNIELHDVLFKVLDKQPWCAGSIDIT